MFVVCLVYVQVVGVDNGRKEESRGVRRKVLYIRRGREKEDGLEGIEVVFKPRRL